MEAEGSEPWQYYPRLPLKGSAKTGKISTNSSITAVNCKWPFADETARGSVRSLLAEIFAFCGSRGRDLGHDDRLHTQGEPSPCSSPPHRDGRFIRLGGYAGFRRTRTMSGFSDPNRSRRGPSGSPAPGKRDSIGRSSAHSGNAEVAHGDSEPAFPASAVRPGSRRLGREPRFRWQHRRICPKLRWASPRRRQPRPLTSSGRCRGHSRPQRQRGRGSSRR